jgi:HD-like signal output (HDOD) protein
MAGLLHRAGAALALQTVAAAELAQRRRVGATLRGRLSARHEPLLAAALLRAWKMPAVVAAAVRGWQKFSAVEPRRSEAMTVYVSHLLAAEMLQPEFFTPGLIAGVARELSIDSQHIAAVRAQSPGLQRLIGAYSR